MTDADIADFWKRMTAITAGVLGTQNGAARMVPMSHRILDGNATIWFITAQDTDLAEAVEHGSTAATYVIAEDSAGLYATIKGELVQNREPALRVALWSVEADNWFHGGKDDPKVCVLGLEPTTAEIWLTPTSGLSFAFNFVRAQVTGEHADMGSHGKLSAADMTRSRQPA